MCSWLTYPTELGREPDEIEQMAVIPLRDTLDLYVFRFRTLGKPLGSGQGLARRYCRTVSALGTARSPRRSACDL
jgi:hypothetical protein